MKLKFIVILLFLFNVSFALTAQHRTLSIQIDTINTFDSIKTILNFHIALRNQLYSTEKFDSTQNYFLNKYPNFTNTVQLEHDSSIIEIPIDLNGSYITIENAYSLQGSSLRINSLKIYKTQPKDTTFTIIQYFRQVNGVVEERAFKVKEKLKIQTEVSPPKAIGLVINGKNYLVELHREKKPGVLISHGHGYQPKKFLDKNGDYKKKLTRIYVNSKTIEYYWTGSLKIDK